MFSPPCWSAKFISLAAKHKKFLMGSRRSADVALAACPSTPLCLTAAEQPKKKKKKKDVTALQWLTEVLRSVTRHWLQHGWPACAFAHVVARQRWWCCAENVGRRVSLASKSVWAEREGSLRRTSAFVAARRERPVVRIFFWAFEI